MLARGSATIIYARRLRTVVALAGVAALVGLSGCAEVAINYAFYPVVVTEDLPSPNYVTGFLVGDHTNHGRIAWTGVASPEDPIGVPPDPVGDARAEAGSDFQGTTGTDQGYGVLPDEFVSDPLPQAVHLNVSRLVQLDLWLTGSVKPAATTVWHCYNMADVILGPLDCPPTVEGFESYVGPCKGVALDIEVYAGDKLLTGAIAGQTFDYNTPEPAADPGYTYCAYRMPAEIATLDAGTVLKIKILHISQGGMIQYGAAEGHRSQIRLAFFDPEEWLYRDPATHGKDVPAAIAPSAAAPAPSKPPAGGGSLGLEILAAGMGLVFLRTPGARGRAALLALVSLSATASGCLGSGSGHKTALSDDPQGSFSIQQVKDDNSSFASKGNGSILGLVHDENGVPLSTVHVSLLGTSSFSDSDSKGHFALKDLRPGAYTLRFDRHEFRSLEAPVTVRAGFVAHPDVTLVPLTVLDANLRPHRHDYWAKGPVETVFDDDVATTCTIPLLSTGVVDPCQPRTQFEIRPSADLAAPATVLPGTYEVEAAITWDKTKVPVTRMGLLVHPNSVMPCMPYCAYNWTEYSPREGNQPIHIATSWEMADAGHQEVSSWAFQLYWAPSDFQGAQVETMRYLTSQVAAPTFHVKLQLHKGVVPYEPPHPNSWGNGTSKLVSQMAYDVPPQNAYACAATYQVPNSPYTVSQTYYSYPQGVRHVPADTTWIEVTFNQSRDLSPDTAWGFLYHPANVRGDYGNYGVWRWVDNATATHPKAHQTLWRVALRPGDADDVYSKTSNVGFMVYPRDPSAACSDENVNGRLPGLHLEMTVAAHRDPMPS